MWSETTRKPSGALGGDLCGSGVIDSPSVSGGVPRGCLWRVSKSATELPHQDKRPGNEVLGVFAKYLTARNKC